MNKNYLLAIILTLTGCQTPTQLPHSPVWKVISNKDDFSDETMKLVTVGEAAYGNLLVTKTLKIYPFVGLHNDKELYVGIRSGGTIRLPTGTVQLRIDDNPAWTISPEETPIYLAPNLPNSMPNLDKNIEANIMENMTKIMSPYTAATGDKANKILKEMINGKVIKYRTIGMNQASSTTGEVKIDSSFLENIESIGINPQSP